MIVSSGSEMGDILIISVPKVPAIVGNDHAVFDWNESHGCSLSFFWHMRY